MIHSIRHYDVVNNVLYLPNDDVRQHYGGVVLLILMHVLMMVLMVYRMPLTVLMVLLVDRGLYHRLV